MEESPFLAEESCFAYHWSMAFITSTIALNLTEPILKEFRATLEKAVGSLPLSLLTMTWDAEKSVVLFEVQYDESDLDLDRNIVDRLIGVIERALPSESINDLPFPEVNDPELGEFFWDMYWWESESALPPPFADISFKLAADNVFEDVQPQLERARAVAATVAERDTEWKSIVVRDMYENFNANWNRGERLTEEAFANQLSLNGVTFRNDGATYVYYGAGDMFWEHEVELIVDADGSSSVGLIG